MDFTKVDFNKRFNTAIKHQIKASPAPISFYANMLDVSMTTIKYKLQEKTKWTLEEAFKLAFYFSLNIESAVLGAYAYNQSRYSNFRRSCHSKYREYLIENKMVNTLGKLTANNFFDNI